MSQLTATTRGGEIMGFEPQDARTVITAHTARSEVEARKGNVDAAVDHADKALAIARAFVVWWDSQGNVGGNPTVTDRLRLEDVAPDLDRMQVSRWRKALVGDDDEDAGPYLKALEKAQARIRRLCDMKGSETIAKQFTGEVQWYTPVKYLDAARAAMGGIDLDPASNAFANKSVNAPRFYSERDDGLVQPWSGRVWLNPPYKMPAVKQFTERMVRSWSSGEIDAGIVLTNNATDTSWWHIMTGVATAVCFTYGRISFYNEDGEHSSPTNGQNFHYFGSDVEAFGRAFDEIGRCMVLA